MTDFLTHIELQDSTASDYDRLDEAMAAVNFSKTVQSKRGISYQMPAATYFSQSFNMSAAEVRNLAMVAAQGTGRRYDIVTTSGDVAFFLHPTV